MSSYNKNFRNKKIKALQACRYKRTHKASLSIEAAMCFCLFIIAMAILIMPFDMMNTDRKIRGLTEAICKDACQYAYTYYRLQGKREESGENYDRRAMENIKGVFIGGAVGSFAVSRINADIKDKNIKNISGILSSCMSDGETICIRIDYKYSLPIGILGKNSIDQTVIASRRAWIGADGGKSGESGINDDEYVYIGKNATRYHIDRRCHYLYNDLQSASFSSVESLRNDNGARYHACERCGSQGGTTVYIMPSGTRYHFDPDCNAIIAYVQRVKRSEVEHLGVCSYFGGSH